MNSPQPSTLPDTGATAVITHRVQHDKQDQYNRWLDQISPACRASPGHLDWHIIRPIPSVTQTYTIIIRFDTPANLKAWLESPARKSFIEQVQPFLDADDQYAVTSGLDFWFVPDGLRTKIPVRWKQFLITWSAIFPLVLLVGLFIRTLTHTTKFGLNHYANTFVVTGIVVFLMVYVVMPNYTRLLKDWLFSE